MKSKKLIKTLKKREYKIKKVKLGKYRAADLRGVPFRSAK